MDTGAILTTKEAETILRRLDNITRRTADRQIREQCRMAVTNHRGKKVYVNQYWLEED